MSINKLFGQFVCERLKVARTEAGGSLPWPVVAGIVQLAFEEEAKHFAAFHPPPKQPKAAPVPRKRNEHIDAFCEAVGGDPLQMTKSAIATVAVAFAEIKTVCPDVTPEELRKRTAKYKEKHRDWPLTATAVAKYWDQLGPSHWRTQSAQADPYVEPANWQQMATRAFPHLDFSEKRWDDISILVRKDILSKTAP